MAFQIKLAVLVVAYFAQTTLVQGTLFYHCDLQETGVYTDPQIVDADAFLDKGRREFPAAAVSRALAQSPARKAVFDAAKHAQALNRQAAAARNRSKRAVGAPHLAATKFSTLCRPKEKRIQFSLDYDGAFCHVIEPLDLSYYECENSQCDYHNPFPFFQSYKCEPDTYVYLKAMSFCEPGEIREQVFYVPINCCCRRYSCNMSKKYKIPRLM